MLVDPGWSPDLLVAQRRGDWCWAACCEMASSALRRPRSQEEFASDLAASRGPAEALSETESQAATDFEIVRALAGRGAPSQPKARKKYTIVETGHLIALLFEWGEVTSANSLAVEELQAGKPVVMGLADWRGMSGHAVFVTSMRVERVDDPVGDLARAFGKKVLPAEGMPEPANRYRIRRISFFDPAGSGREPLSLADDEIVRHLRFLMSPKMARAVLERADKAVYESNRRAR